jgi:hypothetical protein
MSAEEERMIKLAIKNSLTEKHASIVQPTLTASRLDDTHETVLTTSGSHSILDEVEEVKTYRPTEQ